MKKTMNTTALARASSSTKNDFGCAAETTVHDNPARGAHHAGGANIDCAPTGEYGD
jgi:hypothetical protein